MPKPKIADQSFNFKLTRREIGQLEAQGLVSEGGISSKGFTKVLLGLLEKYITDKTVPVEESRRNVIEAVTWNSFMEYLREERGSDFNFFKKAEKEALQKALSRDISPDLLHRIFTLITNSGAGQAFLHKIDRGHTVFQPSLIRPAFLKWERERSAMIGGSAQSTRDLPLIEDSNAKHLDSRIEYIEVKEPLITVGKTGQASRSIGQMDHGNAADRIQTDRISWAIKAILEEMDVDGAIRVYTPQRSEDISNGKDCRYRLISFRTNDGQTHQLAINIIRGYGTYVLKDPVNITLDNSTPTDISSLLIAGTAFPVKCVSRKQFTGKMIEILKTPLSDIPPYHTTLARAYLKDPLIASIIAHTEALRTKPKTTSGSVNHGPLAEKWTWAAANTALNQQAIKGLEQFNSLSALVTGIDKFCETSKEKPESPCPG